MHKLLYFILILLTFILGSCIGQSHVIEDKERKANEKPKEKVLVVVVENNDFKNDLLEMYYNNFLTRPIILSLFSEVTGVASEILAQCTLNQIIDNYGEQMVIDRIEKAAGRNYQQIVVLTDEKARLSAFLDCLKSFDSHEYSLDLILDLHAGPDILEFADNEAISIQSLISKITDVRKIRSVYQTCCYGSSMIKEWTQAGVLAVNGSNGLNSFVIYSPSFFLENWINGQTFSESVHGAYAREKMFLDDFITHHMIKGLSLVILSTEVLMDSYQNTGGNSQLLWK